MAEEVFIHVGLQRCASTLIEHAFQAPDQPVSRELRDRRILPLTDLHLFLRDRRADAFWTDAFVTEVRESYVLPVLEDENWRAAFLTEEGLSVTCLPDGPGIDVAARARHLKAMFDGLNVTVMLVVRDQVSFLRSLYALHLQNGGTSGFQDLADAIPDRALNWCALADIYAEVFGREGICVVPYNAEAYAGGDPQVTGFLAAMQSVMGIEAPQDVPRNHLYNPGIKTADLPLQLAANRGLVPELAARVSDLVRSGVNKPFDILQTIKGELGREQATEVRTALNARTVDEMKAEAAPLSGADANSFLSRFEAGNRELCETYMPRYEASPFVVG